MEQALRMNLKNSGYQLPQHILNQLQESKEFKKKLRGRLSTIFRQGQNKTDIDKDKFNFKKIVKDMSLKEGSKVLKNEIRDCLGLKLNKLQREKEELYLRN